MCFFYRCFRCPLTMKINVTFQGFLNLLHFITCSTQLTFYLYIFFCVWFFSFFLFLLFLTVHCFYYYNLCLLFIFMMILQNLILNSSHSSTRLLSRFMCFLNFFLEKVADLYSLYSFVFNVRFLAYMQSHRWEFLGAADILNILLLMGFVVIFTILLFVLVGWMLWCVFFKVFL